MALPPRPNSVPPADSLYDTLLIVASVLLFIALVFISVRSIQFYGSLWPMGGS